MTAAPMPSWLVDAVVGLVASAYQAGRADATVTTIESAVSENLTLGEAASALRVGMTTMNRLVTSGELPSFRVGARRFVRSEDLDAYRARAS